MESKRSSLRIATSSSRDATVTDLMKRIKDLLGQGKFLKVHDLLLERENNLQNELEKLRTDLVLVELERSKYKKAVENFQDGQVLKGKNEEICDLNEELSQHRDQIFESDKLVEVYSEKLNCSNLKVAALERELEDLKGVKSLADKKHSMEVTECLEQLKKQSLEAGIEKRNSNKIIEEMNRKISEDYHTIEELKSKLLEADAAKRKSDVIVEQMRRQVAVVDFLTKNMQELESEIKRLKDDKLVDIQSMEDMRLQKMENSQIVEGLKRQLAEAGIEKRKSNETIEEMNRRKSEDYQAIDELKSKLLEADVAKRNSDVNVEQMRRPVAVVDCLIKNMQELEYEIKRLKNDKLLDVKSMEDMRLQKMRDTQIVEGLKRQLAAAGFAKRKSDETIVEMTCSKISEVECLNAKLQKMDNEIKILEGQKLLDFQTMEELKAQKTVDSQMVEELRKQLLESDFEKSKLDEAIGTMKRQMVDMDCLNVKLKDEIKKFEEELRKQLLESDFEKSKLDEAIGTMKRQMVDMDCLNVKLKDEIKKFEEELRRQLLESDFERRKFDEAVGAMKCQMVDMDCLNVKLKDEIKKFEEERILGAQTMDEMRRQKEENYRTVEDLKKQLLGADIEKKKSSEIAEDMRRDRILKLCILNAKLQETEAENKALKGDKMMDLQTVKKLRRLLSGADIEKTKAGETIQEMRIQCLKLNQTMKDMQSRLSDQEEIIRRFETNQMMRHDKLKAYQASEVRTEKLHQDGRNSVQDSTCDNGRLISPHLHSGTMLQGSEIIEISDNDDDETEHGRSAEASGLKSTNYSSEDEKCKKVVSFSQLISPCTSSLKRKCNSPGKEEKVEQQNKRYNQE